MHSHEYRTHDLHHLIGQLNPEMQSESSKCQLDQCLHVGVDVRMDFHNVHSQPLNMGIRGLHHAGFPVLHVRCRAFLLLVSSLNDSVGTRQQVEQQQLL